MMESRINNNNKKNDCDDAQTEYSSKYGIKGNKCQPQMKYLIAFENDMTDFVDKIKFGKVKSNF